MGKIQYKKITSDGTEGRKYSSLYTRKVIKKVGDKGDYSDVVLNSPFLKLEKTGTGTTINPFIYQFDVENSFVNSLSAQKTLMNDFKEKRNNIEGIKNELLRFDKKNLYSSYKSVSFSINIFDYLNKQLRHQTGSKDYSDILSYIHNPEDNNFSFRALDYLDKRAPSKGWHKNNHFRVNGLKGEKIHYLKTTFINDDSNVETLKYKEETRQQGSKRISIDGVSNISKLLNIKINYPNTVSAGKLINPVFEFYFEKNGMPITYTYLLDLIKQNSIKGNAVIQFYIEYN